MKISTKGRYALRMLLDLAQNQGEFDYVPLKDISIRQGISKKYLEQIITLLNRAGLLRTARGNNGGYRLVKSPEEYTVWEILCMTEGMLAPVSCLEFEPNNCERVGECQTLYVWAGLQKVIKEYLCGITLQDIINHNLQLNDYSI